MLFNVQGIAPLLMVFDMQASLDFYCKIIGFEIAQSAGPEHDIGWVLLKLQHIELMLNTAYEIQDRPAAQSPERAAAHADTCLYFGCNDIDGLYNHLLCKGAVLKPPCITQYGFKAIELSDPDGYHLVFHWPVK